MDHQSLNLNTLANSLPPSNLANAEKDLMDKFKAAALSITTLYKSSRRTSKKSYNAGYAAACQDLLLMIQQGVSDSQMQDGLDGESGGMGMTIGRVMDWVEARFEAVKAREEEEDEDEEKSRSSVGASVAENSRPSPSGRDASSAANNAARAPGKVLSSNAKEQPRPTSSLPIPITPHTPAPTPSASDSSTWRLPSSPTPSPPSSRLRLPELAPTPLGASNVNAKIRMFSQAQNHSNPKSPTPSSLTPSTSFGTPIFGGVPPTTLLSPLEIPSMGAGTKRRHDLMVMLNPSENSGADAPGAGTSAMVGSRRRTRSTRERERERDVNEMDVDERERKRVARR